MADEIRQDLGFDAAQALETINNLNAGFDKLFQTLNTSPRAFDSFNQRGDQTIQTLKNIAAQVKTTSDALSSIGTVPVPGVGAVSPTNANAQAAAASQLTQSVVAATAATNSLGQAAKQTGSATTNALQSSTRAAGGFALSLETITRVLGTQVIVRTLGAIQRGIEQSFDDFIKLEQALGQLSAVSGDSIAHLQTELVALSDAFNVPLLDVVKAKYEIIQNGFISTADSVTVLTAALKFARIANVDAGTSAGLISGALNAAGDSADAAELQVAKFTKTIEQAKLTGGELANSVARFAPLGNELGASNDELLAAFSTLVAGGTKANEAATQVRQSLVALLKPSADLQKAFKQLGVENGQQIIQTFGFRGALEAVINTTDRSAGSIEKLFPSMRALTGVLIEAGGGASRFTQNLEATRSVSAEFANKKFNATIDTNVEEVTKAFNEFKNFLTTEVGRSLILTTKSVLDLAGGITNLIDVFRGVVPTLAAVTAAIVVYTGAVALASARNKLNAISFTEASSSAKLFGGVLTGLVAVFAAFEAGKTIGQIVTDSFNTERNRLEQEGQKTLQVQREQDSARLDQEKQANRDRFQLIDQAIAQEQSAYNKQLDVANESNKQLIDDDKRALDRVIEGRQKFADDLKKAAQAAENQATESRRISNAEIVKLDDQRFNQQEKNVSALGQITDNQQRADQIFALGRKQLAQATTEEEAKAARATFDRSDAFRQQALESAKTLGSTTDIADQERQIERVARSRIDAEVKFQKTREAQAALLRQQAAEEEARVDKLKSLSKTFLDNSKLFDKQGNPLQGDELTKHADAAKKALADIQKLAFDKSGKFNITDLFSFDALQRELEQSVSGAELNSLKVTPQALDNIVSQIQGTLDKADVIINVSAKLGIDPKQLEGLSKPDALNFIRTSSKDIEASGDRLNQQLAQRADLERQIAEDQTQAANSFSSQLSAGEKVAKALQIATTPGFATDFGKQDLAASQADIDEIRQEIHEAFTSPNLTKDLVDHLTSDLQEVAKNAPSFINIDVSKAQHELQLLQAAAADTFKVNDLNQQGVTPDAVDQNKKNLQDATDQLNIQQQIQDRLKESQAASADNATSSITWADQAQLVAAASQTIANNFALAAQSMDDLNNGLPGFGSPTIQPTAQIAASTPFQATVNPTQQTQVSGGVNVTVNQDIATNDPQQLARDLIPAINREIRRNASALRA